MPNEINNNDDINDIKWSEMLTNGYRGDEPEDIKMLCLQLCKEYLGGVWHKIPEEKINIRRITGGLSNQLYYFGVSPHIKPISDEPTEVAIRLYVKKHIPVHEECENERLYDTVIGMILSENKLSPKIYGLFGNGEILKYYKNHQFQLEQQNDPELVRELAQKLAKFHSLKAPIKKNHNLAFDVMREMYSKAYEMYPISQLMDECKCETLKTINLMEEVNWMQKVVKDSNSPIVFSHYDFRGSNILVIDSDANDYDSQSRIVLCDYEYADYYNRGMDLSSIFIEWGRPLDEWLNITEFPEPSLMTPFLNAYVEESANIYGNNYLNDEINSVEHIIYETNVFILLRILFGAIMGMRMNVESSKLSVFSDKKLQMGLSEMSIKTYLQLKSKLSVEKF